MTVLVVAPATQVPEGTACASPDAVSVVTQVLAHGRTEPVLIVAADRAGEEAARAARLVLADRGAGVLLHDAPPTAFFVAVAALRMLPPVALGLAPALLDAVARDTRTAALLSSVTALRRPRPSVALDLASRLPGSVFRVDWTAQVVGRGQDLDLPTGFAAITSAGERPVADGAAVEGTQVELATDGSFWGAKRWFEATVLLRPLEDVVESQIQPDVVAALGRCPSCRRPVAGPRCVFCQIPVRHAAADHSHLGGHV